MLIAVVDGGRNCGKTKRMQDFIAEAAKRGENVRLFSTRYEQKMLRGAGHPAIDMLTYILAKEEEKS